MNQLFFQTNKRKSLGDYGETLASEYLQKHGYSIIDRNFKARYGEIDIIAVKNNSLVFIEVKTRMGKKYGLPEEAVTPKKMHEVKKTAQYYSLLHPQLPKSLRIDVIGIQLFPDRTLDDFRHIENASQ